MNNTTKLEFIYQYLKYLNRWNKSASLVSVIQSIEKNSDLTDEQISGLYSIGQFEYEDTIHSFSEFGDSNILSLEDVYSLYLISTRDEKIKQILNDRSI